MNLHAVKPALVGVCRQTCGSRHKQNLPWDFGEEKHTIVSMLTKSWDS